MRDLTDRHRKIVKTALDAIGRESTADGVAGLRRMATSIGAKHLAELLGRVVGHDAGLHARSLAWEEANRLRKDNHDLQFALKMAQSAQRGLEREVAQLQDEVDTLRRSSFALANATRVAHADERARKVRLVIDDIRRKHPEITNEGIARELARRRVEPPRGGKNWTRMQVHRVLNRTT
jgi:hypothetical protein